MCEVWLKDFLNGNWTTDLKLFAPWFETKEKNDSKETLLWFILFLHVA